MRRGSRGWWRHKRGCRGDGDLEPFCGSGQPRLCLTIDLRGPDFPFRFWGRLPFPCCPCNCFRPVGPVGLETQQPACCSQSRLLLELALEGPRVAVLVQRQERVPHRLRPAGPVLLPGRAAFACFSIYKSFILPKEPKLFMWSGSRFWGQELRPPHSSACCTVPFSDT